MVKLSGERIDEISKEANGDTYKYLMMRQAAERGVSVEEVEDYWQKVRERLVSDSDNDDDEPIVTYLYRHFDADETLLYVGISKNWLSRLIQHSRQSEWYDQIVRVTMEKFDSREEAREAEEQEIRSKCPPYNKTW